MNLLLCARANKGNGSEEHLLDLCVSNSVFTVDTMITDTHTYTTGYLEGVCVCVMCSLLNLICEELSCV